MRIAALDGLAKAHQKELVRAYVRRRRMPRVACVIMFFVTLYFLAIAIPFVMRSLAFIIDPVAEVIGTVPLMVMIYAAMLAIAAAAAYGSYVTRVAIGVGGCLGRGECIACGYSLKGLERRGDRVKCPECGRESPVAADARQSDGAAQSQ